MTGPPTALLTGTSAGRNRVEELPASAVGDVEDDDGEVTQQLVGREPAATFGCDDSPGHQLADNGVGLVEGRQGDVLAGSRPSLAGAPLVTACSCARARPPAYGAVGRPREVPPAAQRGPTTTIATRLPARPGSGFSDPSRCRAGCRGDRS